MPTNRNLNQRIRATLYQLKKNYGAGPFSIYSFLGATSNVETGGKSVSKDVTVIPRVIVLPAKIVREVVQSISQISANKAFVYGGTFDSRTRLFIIDRRDCPALDTLKDDDWFVFDGRKYEIKNIQEFEYDTAWVVTARHLLGDPNEQIVPIDADHLLDLSQSASASL